MGKPLALSFPVILCRRWYFLTPIQGKYVKTLPWHASQKILIDDDTESRVSLRVIPNFELTQEILKHGASVKVIKPDWLAQEVRSVLEEALKRYRNEEEQK